MPAHWSIQPFATPAPAPAAQPTMMRFLERFECIGSQCELSCCERWEITVDESHYHKLKKAMTGTGAGRERFRASVKRNRTPGADLRNNYALLVLDAEARCSLLDADKLCSAQRAHGESVLPDTCASYPRHLTRVGEKLEMTATVACPEAARQLLLHEDGADLVPLDPELVPRMKQITQVQLSSSRYARHAPEVRALGVSLLGAPGYTASQRLSFLAFFGQRTAGFFYKDVTADPSVALAVEIARMERPEVLAELARQFAAVEVPAPLAEKISIDVLASRVKDAPWLLSPIIEDAVATYTGGAAEIDEAALYHAYRARRESLPAAMRDRIDGYVTRFAINYWMRRIYLVSPTLLRYTQDLSLRLSIVRILLLGQSRVTAAIAATDPAEQLRLLDAAAVDVFSRVARGLDHSPTFMKRIDQSLDERGQRTFAHVVALTKI